MPDVGGNNVSVGPGRRPLRRRLTGAVVALSGPLLAVGSTVWAAQLPVPAVQGPAAALAAASPPSLLVLDPEAAPVLAELARRLGTPTVVLPSSGSSAVPGCSTGSSPAPGSLADVESMLAGGSFATTLGWTSPALTPDCRPSAVTVFGAGSGVLPRTRAFPNASTTGVPSGTTLTPYTGPCTITTAGTVIENKVVDCPLLIKASGVVVRRSLVRATVDSDSETPTASVLIEDTEVDAGTAFRAAVDSHNVTVLRSNLHGGAHSVQCWDNCRVEDSWLHGQYVPPDASWHLNAFLSNGGSRMILRRNTLQCDAALTAADGGCSSNLSIFGDFGSNTDYLIDNNLFVASVAMPYCTFAGSDPVKPYGTQVSGIRFVNNVFQRGTNGRCGLYGPVTSFDSDAPGAQWSNNVWDDGTVLPTP